MTHLSEATLLAFRAELQKVAGFADAVARAAPRLRAAGSLAGVGALGGAVVGAGVEGYRGYQRPPEEGGGVLGAVQGVTSGAARGALLGAAGGGAAGALTGRGAGLVQNRMLGGAARVGQRQVHSLTGMLQPAELEAIGGGAAGARALHEQARSASFAGRLQGQPTPALDAAKGALTKAEAAQNMGLTSIPGYVSSARKNGLGSTLKASWQDQYANSPKMTALSVGVPAAFAAKGLLSKESPDGAGKGESLGETIGGTLGGVVGGAMPLTGGLVAGTGLALGGKYLGRGVDKLRGRRTAPASHPADEGSNEAAQRVLGPGVTGYGGMG